MAYVGAGHLIHAFFLNASSADGFAPQRQTHEAGEEAWAYLPRANHKLLRDVFTADFAGFRGDKPSLMNGRCRAFEAKLNLEQAEEHGELVVVAYLPGGGREEDRRLGRLQAARARAGVRVWRSLPRRGPLDPRRGLCGYWRRPD